MPDSPEHEPPPSSNPFQTLQGNASALFEQILKKNEREMQCRSGCSKCCQVELSVFLGEAQLVLDWFSKLSTEEKEKIKKAWEEPEQKKSCTFLRDGRCSIYEARPTHCRMQGAPLSQVQEPAAEKNHDKNAKNKPKKGNNEEIVRIVEACTLNFSEGKTIPKDASSWFEMGRMKNLQAIAENFAEKNSIIVKELMKLGDEQKKVTLRKLHQLLREQI